MVEQIFLSSQVKRSLIISTKYGIYELSHELPNDNLEIPGKSQNFIELYPSAQSSFQNENFVNTSKKLPRNRN